MFMYEPFEEDYLYHYTKTETAINFILKNGNLKFNSLKNTGDPLEFLKYTPLAFKNGDFTGLDWDYYYEHEEKLNKEVKENHKVACFCVDDFTNLNDSKNYYFSKGYGKSRMWTQYTENHKGICLIFSKIKLLTILNKKFNGNVFSNNVKYTNELNDLDNFIHADLDSTDSRPPEEKIKEIINKNIESFIFRKFIDYKDECEFRIAIYDNVHQDHILIDFEDSLEGIILGENFYETYATIYLKNIEAYTKKHNIKLFDILWDYKGPVITDR